LVAEAARALLCRDDEENGRYSKFRSDFTTHNIGIKALLLTASVNCLDKAVMAKPLLKAFK
jgi:hypothetical protein